MRPLALLLGLLLAVSACAGDESASSVPDEREVVTTQAGEAADGPADSADATIDMTATTIGPARLGMTEAELVGVLEAGWMLSADELTFEEGFQVRPVTRGEETLFFVRFSPDSNQVDTMVTTHPSVQTEQGLSPGDRIDDAEERLGPASFAFYQFEGGRESVQFPVEVPQLVRPRAADGVGIAAVYDFETDVEDPIGPYSSNEHTADAVIYSLTIELG